MAWGAAIGAIGGALISSQASDDAADAQVDASQKAVEERRRQFNKLLELQEPYRQVGENALYEMAGMTGVADPNTLKRKQEIQDQIERKRKTLDSLRQVSGATSDSIGKDLPPTANPDVFKGHRKTQDQEEAKEAFQIEDEISELENELKTLESQDPTAGGGGDEGFDIQETPGYQFRYDQGLEALNNSLAATGNRFSGRAMKEAQQYGQGMAKQEFSRRFNRLASLSGRGQTAASNAGSAAMQTGQGVANALQQQGRARAMGIAGQNQAIQGGIGNYLSYQQNQNMLSRLGTSNTGGGTGGVAANVPMGA